MAIYAPREGWAQLFSRLFHSPLAQPWQQANSLPSGLCEGSVPWSLKTVEISHQSLVPTVRCSIPRIHCNWGMPNIYLVKPITHPVNWRQSTTPTGSSMATRLGLCSSLVYFERRQIGLRAKKVYMRLGLEKIVISYISEFHGNGNTVSLTFSSLPAPEFVILPKKTGLY